MNFDLPNFNRGRVLVVGDVMLDRYWEGDTSRISPEAPVPVVHIKKNYSRLGGASNVALNVSSLGSRVALVSMVGDDEAAGALQTLLNENQIEHHLHATSDQPTIHKLRIISHNQQLIRLDFEENFYGVKADGLLKTFREILPNFALVIISDYGKGIAASVPQIIKLAREYKLPVLVDPKGKDFSIYRQATMITPNLHEFEAVVGSCSNVEQIEEKGRALIKELNLEALLITKGADGMSLIHKRAPAAHISTFAREVFDVTGAGDTVIATLGACLASGAKLEDAVKLSNVAAGIVVRKFGTATTTELELRQTLQKNNASVLGIVNEEHLLKEIADAKVRGEKIVMTNGCFDILHAGHITYLEQAKALGTRLIVAVNDDASVKRLKGEHRPINSLQHRMTVLSGLRAVDWVVPFSEDTPERLITAVTPNILVKGGDYRVDEIAGAKHVLNNKGEVKVLSFVDSQSTSLIVERIRGEKA